MNQVRVGIVPSWRSHSSGRARNSWSRDARYDPKSWCVSVEDLRMYRRLPSKN